MEKKVSGLRMFLCGLFFFASILGSIVYAQEKEAVNLILKNDSSSSVEVELIDQYGGNFTVSIDGGTSQNQALKVNSEIKVSGNAVHLVVPEDEGMEVLIAAQ